MSSAIALPLSPRHLPEIISTITTISNDAGCGSLDDALPFLSGLEVPDYITGSSSTPAIWWFAAHLAFPSARLLCQQSNGDWLNLSWAQQPPSHITAANTAPTEQASESTQQSKEPAAEPSAPIADSLKADQEPLTKHASDKPALQVKNWEFEVFIQFAWGQHNAQHTLDNFIDQAHTQIGVPANLEALLHSAAQDGQDAHALVQVLDRKISAGDSYAELDKWLDALAKDTRSRIIKHLRISLSKAKDFSKKKQQHSKTNHEFQITLPYTQLQDNLHPQSLRALKPCAQWHILVDETGKDFSSAAQDLTESDTKLGRIIALVMPDNHALTPLKTVTHATDLSYAQIQDLLAHITQSHCGILGAHLKNDLRSHNWMAAVNQLIRWVILLLPIQGATRIRVDIENRGSYIDSQSLLALQDTLENELKLLAPERFAGVQLSLNIMSKDNPYNGYVDVIANCWGSNSPTKRKLLARTGWRGHCLLQNSDIDRIEHLYRNISYSSGVSASDWFELCSLAAQEPDHSLLHDMLKQLGSHSEHDPIVWQKYLHEARQRIANKNYTAGSLGRALQWLHDNQPSQHALPALLELQLLSTQLAAANHQGRSDLQQAQRILQLAQQLKDEAAPVACEAALRIAISASNCFDFVSPVPFIEQWVKEPIAVPGLLNHAKLHSTLGQLMAFQGQHDRALQAFATALIHFSKLSDQAQEHRNIVQTSSYQAIVLLDMHSADAEQYVRELLENSTKKQGLDSIKQLSRSGDLRRFEHYLLLRWLMCQPQHKLEREGYLDSQAYWQLGEGHPWMLINAYRAWLLADAGRLQEASDYMQIALNDCFEDNQSAILQWMGHCLSALASSLGIPVLQLDSAAIAAFFPSDQLSSLTQAGNHKARLAALQILLPFNFH